MKYLIYELFSGVGLCNQLFSFETAIYLANISERKLILLIKNPLCHCGKSSWDYGYFLNFFTNDYLYYLPNGLEVCYKTIPANIKNIISDKQKTKTFIYSDKFSNIVFIDDELDTLENSIKIKDFCHYRKKEFLQFDQYDNYAYFYINQSNASRCFYNFYTIKQNYKLMYDICLSIKFKPIFYHIAEKIYANQSNQYTIFLHLRFGDHHKTNEFITRNNKIILDQIIPFIEGHYTNIIKPSIYLLVDNKNNKEFFEKTKQFKFNYTEDLVNNTMTTYFNNNKMIFTDYHKPKNSLVQNAIVEMLLCTKADEFLGTVSSTFSHYIQYLRYMNNKSYYHYNNLPYKHVEYCRLIPQNNNSYEWIKYKFTGGHPVSWHYFWNPNTKKNQILMTIEGKTDGFGSQLQAYFSLMAYCKYKDYEYIHNPIYRMHHNDKNMENYPTYMNNFIHIESKYRSISQLSNYETTILHKMKEGPFVHGSLHTEYFYNQEFLKDIKTIYFTKEKPSLSYYENSKNLAIHIRRGDVTASKYPNRYISNQVYIDLLKQLDNQFNLQNYQIHLFSQGEYNDFIDIIESFPNNLFYFHLNEGIQETFHALVMADILILSKSSFSYCAGLLNSKMVIANLITKWWHKPLKQWKIV